MNPDLTEPATGVDTTTRDVLVVEDEPLVSAVMERVLSHAGYSVAVVTDGAAAISAMRDLTFRAIVCDIRMPGMDGIEFFQHLQAENPDMAHRVVFVTAVASNSGVAEFLKKTGRLVLEKPYDIRRLVQIVAQLVDRPPFPGALI